MRAIEPLVAGTVERDGVELAYEVFGDGEPTVVLLPTWSIIHSRFWKAQIATLARRYRVVTFDGRGIGRSGRPVGSAAYTHVEFTADTLAVLDATGTEQAVLVALSCGALWGVQLAADHPERVARHRHPRPGRRPRPAPPRPGRLPVRRADRRDRGLGEVQPPLLAARLPRLPRVLLRVRCSRNPTRPSRSRTAWAGASEVDPARLADANDGLDACFRESFRSVCARVRCPVLVIHGDEDELRPHAQGAALAEVTGGSLVTVEGGGHGIHGARPGARQPPHPRLRRPGPPGRDQPDVGAGARGDRSGRCTSRRRSGSATPAATWPSPPSCAAATPTCRSTGSPSTRSPRCSTRAGERVHPASAMAGQRVGPRRGRGRRARPPRLPGDPADGRDPRQQLHGVRRRRRRRALRPRRSATRRGTSTTSCTRTRSSSGSPSRG